MKPCNKYEKSKVMYQTYTVSIKAFIYLSCRQVRVDTMYEILSDPILMMEISHNPRQDFIS